MKKLLKLFYFIPFIRKTLDRKYYAIGISTYIVNFIFNYVLRINKGFFMIHFTSRVNCPEKIKICGDDQSGSYLHFATSGGCYYQAINGIEIGEGTIWSYNCSFISANHKKSNFNSHDKSLPIKIGKKVWIGSNCVILPGVEIGDNVIIGAGSIVTKSIPSNSVAVGNPCKVVKQNNV